MSERDIPLDQWAIENGFPSEIKKDPIMPSNWYGPWPPFQVPLTEEARKLTLDLITIDLEVTMLAISACYAGKILDLVKQAKAATEDGTPRLTDPVLAIQRVTAEFTHLLNAVRPPTGVALE